MDGFTEGPPLVYVPVCKHPRDFMFTFGPIGYERVEPKPGKFFGPICVEPKGTDDDRRPRS